MDEPEGEPTVHVPTTLQDFNLARQQRRDDPGRSARSQVWRQEADARWKRITQKIALWRRLTSLAGSVLNAAKSRHRIARLALREEDVNFRAYTNAVAESRWQSVPDIRNGRIATLTWNGEPFR